MADPAAEGVYYDPADSPGLAARVIIDVVDLVTLILLTILFRQCWSRFAPEGYGEIAACLAFLMWWFYLVPLKRSGIGSLGFLIFRVKAVDLLGQTPSLTRMTLRVVATIAFNTFFDLIYLTSDANRQALRDKISGIYIVKRSASPAGRGRFRYARTFFFMYALTYREVARDAAAACEPAVAENAS